MPIINRTVKRCLIAGIRRQSVKTVDQEEFGLERSNGSGKRKGIQSSELLLWWHLFHNNLLSSNATVFHKKTDLFESLNFSQISVTLNHFQ